MLMLDKLAIIKASKEYNIDKYPEHFYMSNLSVLHKACGKESNTKEAVKNLFLWKLGKVSTYQTISAAE